MAGASGLSLGVSPWSKNQSLSLLGCGILKIGLIGFQASHMSHYSSL